MKAGQKKGKKFPRDAWEQGKLGASAKHARKVSPLREAAIDKSLGLEVLSVRLSKDIINKLKKLAKKEGISHIVYMRRLLAQHVKDKQKES